MYGLVLQVCMCMVLYKYGLWIGCGLQFALYT